MAAQKQDQSGSSQQQGGKSGDQQMDQKGGKPGQQGEQSQVQGEGNYTAAKEYDDAQRRFVESGRVEQAARDAEPKSQEEADQMKAAEREGRSHAKDEDPQLRRPGGDLKPRDDQKR